MNTEDTDSRYWLNCTLTFAVAMLVLSRLMLLQRSPNEINIMFCPTRFVVDVTENSKERSVAAEA